MAKGKSDLVKGMGLPFEVLKTLTERVHNAGGTDDSVRMILTDKALLNQVAQILAGATAKQYWYNTANDLDYWLNKEASYKSNRRQFLLKDKRINAAMFPDEFRGRGGRDDNYIQISHICNYKINVDSAKYWASTQGLELASFSELLRSADGPGRLPQVPIVAGQHTWTEPKTRRGGELKTYVPYLHYDGDVYFVGLTPVHQENPETWAYALRRPSNDHFHFGSPVIRDAAVPA